MKSLHSFIHQLILHSFFCFFSISIRLSAGWPGDSSLDNKFWILDEQRHAAVNGYEDVLAGSMVADVAYWLNAECAQQGIRMAAINAAIEESTIRDRRVRRRERGEKRRKKKRKGEERRRRKKMKKKERKKAGRKEKDNEKKPVPVQNFQAFYFNLSLSLSLSLSFSFCLSFCTVFVDYPSSSSIFMFPQRHLMAQDEFIRDNITGVCGVSSPLGLPRPSFRTCFSSTSTITALIINKFAKQFT